MKTQCRVPRRPRRFFFRSLRFASAVLAAGALVLAASVAGAEEARSADGAWTRLEPAALEARRASAGTPEPWMRLEVFAPFALDPAAIEKTLAAAPMEFTPAARDARSRAIVELPTPEGAFEKFEVVESPVMEDGLFQWMAERGWPMRTYKGRAVDSPATIVRLDAGGPMGFHARVIAPGEREYWVDPLWQGDSVVHASFHRRDARRPEDEMPFLCKTDHFSELQGSGEGGRGFGEDRLLTYRLAMAATAEYTDFHSPAEPSVELAQAAIVTMVNRLNELYERDFGFRLVLIANNHLIIFTNSSTDPYTSGNVFAMTGQNQNSTDTRIGNANYDIGHVVDRGDDGGVVTGDMCVSGQKAEGATSLNPPIGDPFVVDYVAHEIGHQFTASHTWDATSCDAGQHVASRAYEPGSGSTIMAYSGICPPQDLQSAADAMFHSGTIDEVSLYLPACGAFLDTANLNAPTVDAGPDHMVPSRTPFELIAFNGEDLDGDSITYSWEQFDTDGSRAPAGADNGTNPLFRTFLPTSAPNRIFPRLSDLLANRTTIGETLPTTNRSMTFRVLVRDNNLEVGRTGFDEMEVISVANAGPFQVLFPNGMESLTTRQFVEWAPAGTNATPINAATVDILLSTDGGQTYPTILASAVPNNGLAEVILPNIQSSAARIRVQATGRIFFDISDRQFSIQPAPNAPLFQAIDAPSFSDVAFGNGNGVAEPGEILAISLEIGNFGGLEATAVQAQLTALTPEASLIQAVSPYPNLAALGGRGANASVFLLHIGEDHPCGDPIALEVQAQSAEGEGTFSVEIETGAPGAFESLLFEGFEDGALPAGWNIAHIAGSNRWAVRSGDDSAGTPFAGSGLASYEPAANATVATRLVTPPVTGASELAFRHSYVMETGFDGLGNNAADGLVIEISTNGGSSWQRLESQIVSGGYTHTAIGTFGFFLAGGRPCWAGMSAGFPGSMNQVVVDLTPFAGQTVRVAFLYCENNVAAATSQGWFLDDVDFRGITTVCEPVPDPTTPASGVLAR